MQGGVHMHRVLEYCSDKGPNQLGHMYVQSTYAAVLGTQAR
jgi:hypothetical protein